MATRERPKYDPNITPTLPTAGEQPGKIWFEGKAIGEIP